MRTASRRSAQRDSSSQNSWFQYRQESQNLSQTPRVKIVNARYDDYIELSIPQSFIGDILEIDSLLLQLIRRDLSRQSVCGRDASSILGHFGKLFAAQQL